MSYKKSIKRYVQRHVESTRDIEYGIALRPAGNGGKYALALGNCPFSETVGSSLGHRTFEPGEVVPVAIRQGGKTIIGTPPPGRTGASPPIIQLYLHSSIAIFSADPYDVEVGVETAVTIDGIGFTEGTIIRAMSGDIQDPLVTISNIAFVDSRTMTFDILIAVEAGDGYLVSLIALR